MPSTLAKVTRFLLGYVVRLAKIIHAPVVYFVRCDLWRAQTTE